MKGHTLFDEVTTGGDVGLFMHRNDGRVEMRNVAAGEQKGPAASELTRTAEGIRNALADVDRLGF